MQSHRSGRREGRRHASGVNAGVAVSLFLFLGFCVGLAGLIITQGSAQRARELARATADGLDIAISTAGASQASVGAAPGFAGAAIVDQPAPPKLSGRVLVVSDLLPPLDGQINALLQGGFAAMEQAGLDVLGTFPSLGLDEEESAVLDESIAEVRTIRGLRPLDSDEVTDAISEWLDSEGEADVLVWIEPSPQPRGLPSMRIFPSSDVLEEAPADFLASLERLLSTRG